MIDCSLGDVFGVWSCPFWCNVLQCCARLWVHSLNYLDRVVVWCEFFNWWCVWASVTMYMVDLWQYCVRCLRSGVIRCLFFLVLYLCHICQCGLHMLILSHICILMRPLAAKPLSIAGLWFTSQGLWNDLSDPVLMIPKFAILKILSFLVNNKDDHPRNFQNK